MIEFIQDYVTKALPPESFKDGERVERSAESELYLVRLGVAGYVHGDQLVDQDYHPIVRQQAVLVVSTDRRFASSGRAGEVIGLDAPQRATSGPGNEVVFSGQPDSTGLADVTLDQLTSDLAASRGEFETYRLASEGEVERLKGLIETGNEAFRTADAAFGEERSTLTSARDQAMADLGESRKAHDDLSVGYGGVREQLEAANARIVDLEAQLAAATKPAAAETAAATETPAKRGAK